MKETKFTITYKKNKLKTIVVNVGSGIFSGILFLLLFFFFHWNLLVTLILSLGSYIGLSLSFTPDKKIGSVSMQNIAGGEELEQQLTEAKKTFHNIQQVVKQIKDSEIAEQAQKLNQIAAELIGYLEKHPDKITYARQFINYYQETASKILSRYAELEHTGLKTKEVLQLKENSKKALQTLHIAFEQQFQKLVKNEMIDMEAEIRLLEQTVEMEMIDN